MKRAERMPREGEQGRRRFGSVGEASKSICRQSRTMGVINPDIRHGQAGKG
jgi:hypothetical protein